MNEPTVRDEPLPEFDDPPVTTPEPEPEPEPAPAPPKKKPVRLFDRTVRIVATVILLAALTAIYLIPFSLIPGNVGQAVVLAALTMLAAGLASRVHHLRVRLDALEAVLDGKDLAPTPQTPSSAPVQEPEMERPLESRGRRR